MFVCFQRERERDRDRDRDRESDRETETQRQRETETERETQSPKKCSELRSVLVLLTFIEKRRPDKYSLSEVNLVFYM